MRPKTKFKVYRQKPRKLVKCSNCKSLQGSNIFTINSADQLVIYRMIMFISENDLARLMNIDGLSAKNLKNRLKDKFTINSPIVTNRPSAISELLTELADSR